MNIIRHNYSLLEIKEIYSKGLLDLISISSSIHKQCHSYDKIYLNTLVSYKTGGCSEDCAYCAQSSRYKTHIENKSIYLNIDEVLTEAKKAKEQGTTRICISASWKHIPDNEHFDNILKIGEKIKEMGLNVCCTLGTVNSQQIEKLKSVGFSAYNHNLDTSERFYEEIITTRTFKDRINTINLLQENNMPYCSGGIIGMGETEDDRLEMLEALANQPKHPFSLPLNILVPIKGTPLENIKPVSHWEMIRLIATARILMPETIICLAAGRESMSAEIQTLCFLAGANSVFNGEKLLTTKNSSPNDDNFLFEILGVH